MTKILYITLAALLATAILTSCGNSNKTVVYDGAAIAEEITAPIMNNIKSEFKNLIDKRDSITKLPTDKQNLHDLQFIDSQIRDADNISRRKFYEAMLPIQDSLDKKFDAAIKQAVKDNNGTIVIDVSVNPAQKYGSNNIDITEQIKKKLK